MRTARSSGVWVMRLVLAACCAAILCGHGLYSIRHSHTVSIPKGGGHSSPKTRRSAHSHSHSHGHSHSHSHRHSHSHHGHSHTHSHGHSHSHSHGDDDDHDHSHAEGSHVHVWVFGWEFVLWTGEPDHASSANESVAGRSKPMVRTGNGDALYLVIVPWLLLPVARPAIDVDSRESWKSLLSDQSRRVCDPPEVPPPRIV